MLQPRHFPDTRPSLLTTLRAQQPGQPAWRDFFTWYAPAVYRVARHRGLDPHDADDIVQQVMLAIMGQIGAFNYDRDRGRFRAWVKTITANKIRDLYRRRSQAGVVSGHAALDDEAQTHEEHWQSEWLLQDLLHCLDLVRIEVSPRQYQAFDLYVLEGCSAEETAQRMGTTRAYVYVTRSQIIRRIRELIRQLEAQGGCR